MSAAKRLSPGASLLRQSRLMAMPAPVPPPPSHFLSNPGVSPHPTIQAITTPKSSHSRGNWGLKRDLPTKTKYPFLRYTALDTLEHFMTYESAADDVLTVKKWQEMDIPILKGMGIGPSTLFSNDFIKKVSVFDGGSDGEKYKWRYEGPFLPDMPAGDFKRYIENKIKPRREEFLAFVAKNQHTKEYAPESLESQSPYQLDPELEIKPEPEIKEAQEAIDPADVDILALRANSLLLERLVLAFLDIPFYSRPHQTHPSGGLHYSRSNAHVRNDPDDGPRPEPKPVPGRSMNYFAATGTLVGIGGIVAKATDAGRLDDTGRIHNNRTHMRKFLPGRANLDALGRVLLEVDLVNEDGSQGNYGDYRSGMSRRAGGLGSDETAADLLNMVPRSYSQLYDSSISPKEGSARLRNKSSTEDVMDLLRDSFGGLR